MFKQQITGKVTRVETINHTRNGNPIKRIAIEVTENRVVDGSPYFVGDTFIARISDNSGLVYQIGNGEFRDEAHTFELTPAGRIRGPFTKA